MDNKDQVFLTRFRAGSKVFRAGFTSDDWKLAAFIVAVACVGILLVHLITRPSKEQLRYEAGTIMAEMDHVLGHNFGRSK